MSDAADNDAQGTSQAGSEGAGEGGGQPQLLVSAQYIKDFSFENPNAPGLLFQLKEQPSVNVEVDTSGRSLGRDFFEVDLKIQASATAQEKTAFVIELLYSGVVQVRNVSEEQKSAFVLVEGPRQLFPFARQIVAHATTQSGYPPLMLNPVDFVALLRRKQQQQRDQGGAEQGESTGGSEASGEAGDGDTARA